MTRRKTKMTERERLILLRKVGEYYEENKC